MNNLKFSIYTLGCKTNQSESDCIASDLTGRGFLIVSIKEKPDLLFSCGAAIAPPIFLAGKILGCRLVFMEPYDFIAFPSLSGKIVSFFVDRLLVQHEVQKKHFKNAEYWGASI